MQLHMKILDTCFSHSKTLIFPITTTLLGHPRPSVTRADPPVYIHDAHALALLCKRICKPQRPSGIYAYDSDAGVAGPGGHAAVNHTLFLASFRRSSSSRSLLDFFEAPPRLRGIFNFGARCPRGFRCCRMCSRERRLGAASVEVCSQVGFLVSLWVLISIVKFVE